MLDLPEREASLAVDVAALYLRYGPLVYRRCLRVLKDESLAEDAMQDVFVRVVDHASRLDDRGLSSLLFQIATQVSLNRLRSRRRHPEDADDMLLARIADADDTAARSMAGALLDKLFGREPPSTRVIATLHLLDGMTLEEVARDVGLSVSGVRKRLRVLRERLERVSGEEAYDEAP